MKIARSVGLLRFGATVFTGRIYDHLQTHAAALKVAHPLLLRAIAAARQHQTRAKWGGDVPWSAGAVYATEKGDRTS